MFGPDHSFSTNPSDFKQFTQSIREACLSLGVFDKAPSTTESMIRSSARRFLSYTNDFQSGQSLSLNSFVPQRHPHLT